MEGEINTTFLTDAVMSGEDWRALELACIRLLAHCGWSNVQDVGQTGDKGADILAVRPNRDTGVPESYLFQVKAVSGADYVGVGAIDQALLGQGHYNAQIVVVMTNGEFTSSAYKRRDVLNRQGFRVILMNGTSLHDMLALWGDYAPGRREPRIYQDNIIKAVVHNAENRIRKSFFIVATGLGKTVIAATITDRLLTLGFKRVLVLCHAVDLAQQLQREFWAQIPKSVPTRLFMDGQAPVPIDGINFGLYQTMFGFLGGIDPDAFDLIIVDEAHHALANAFSTVIEHLKPKHLVAMTATPWRGDGVAIDSLFGEPVDRVSLVDGMRLGYLAKVDYRLMCDNVDWKEVPKLAKNAVSIRDLNRRLFLPQRDEAVISSIMAAAKSVASPKIAVFSPSRAHAEEFARKLSGYGITAKNASIEDKVARRRVLMEFASGRLTALTAVDVLNEGIDVPDVNILVFLRATHSRRIFVQQLGRGLRIAPGKQQVIVLDFVTDIRRISAVQKLDQEAKREPKPGEIETVYLRDGLVTFSNPEAKRFIDAWIDDVASLEDSDDAQKLDFPDSEFFQ